MNNINTLTTGTINGLTDLSLDTLTTTVLNSETIDGNIIYYNRIEGNEIIVDTKLTLTNTGVIAVGSKTITDIELTYLDGVTSNIQKQIDNVAGQELQFQAQIDNHTNQIEDLQASDASQNTLLENLEASVNTYTVRIENLELTDITHSNQIGYLQDETADLYNSEAMFIAQIGVLQDKTYFQTRTSTATIFSTQVNIPNGNIGFYNSSFPNNFYIQSNLASGNNIVLNSGLANTYLQSQNVYLGKTDATTGRKSNLLMLGSDGTTWETQSSAFTETHKSLINTHTNQITLLQEDFLDLQNTDSAQSAQLASLQISDTTQNTKIAFQTLQIDELYEVYTVIFNKTQNITSANTTSTNMNKPLYITSPEALRIYGNHGYISGWSNVTNNRDWYLGTDFANTKRVVLQNDKLEAIHLRSGSRSDNTNLGQNKIITHSNGISFRRGGITAGDALITVGEIGATSTNDTFFRINGNGTNAIALDSGLGAQYLYTNLIYAGSAITNTNTSRKSNIYMYNPAGTDWEIQSSAFTESLKSQVINATANIIQLQTLNLKFSSAFGFGGSKGKIRITRNFDIIGLSVSTLLNSTLYSGSTLFNVGLAFRNTGLYNDLFDATGKFVSMEGFMNFNIQFEMQFTSRNSQLKTLISRIVIRNDENTNIAGALTQFQGIQYNSTQTFHEVVYYNASMKHIIDYGHYIYIESSHQFTTGTLGTLTAMEGTITIERNVL